MQLKWINFTFGSFWLLCACASPMLDPSGNEMPTVIESFHHAWASRYPDFGTAMGLHEFDGKCVKLKNEMEFYDLVLLKRWTIKIDHELARDHVESIKDQLHAFRDILERDAAAVESNRRKFMIPFLPVSVAMQGSLEPLFTGDEGQKKSALERFRQCVEGQEAFAPLVAAAKVQTLYAQKSYGKSGQFPTRKELETYLRQSPEALAAIKKQFAQSGLRDWEDTYAQFAAQVAEYDHFVKITLLAKARKPVAPVPVVEHPVLQRIGKCSAPGCQNLRQAW